MAAYQQARARDIISGALRLLGVIGQGENADAGEAEEGLYSLNSMIDSWQLERLMVYAILPVSFPFVANQMSYTLGPGGDWDLPMRPLRVDQITLNYNLTAPQPLVLPVYLLNLDEYNAIRVPTTSSTIPLCAYVDDSFPLRNIYFYTVPQLIYNANIFIWTPLQSFASVNDLVALPNGYERALRFSLALELAPEYGKTPSQIVAAGALAAKAVIKSYNIKPLYMSVDGALQSAAKGGWNYLTGDCGSSGGQ